MKKAAVVAFVSAFLVTGIWSRLPRSHYPREVRYWGQIDRDQDDRGHDRHDQDNRDH